MKAAGYSDTGYGSKDDFVEPPSDGVKRTRRSSPERDMDDRKLPAVTPEKKSNPNRESSEV